MHENTLSQAVANASLVLGVIHPITPSQPVERVALGTPVQLWNGIDAVICGHSTCDGNNYQVTWFDRHFWQQRFRWISRSCFEVYQKQTAEAVASAAA